MPQWCRMVSLMLSKQICVNFQWNVFSNGLLSSSVVCQSFIIIETLLMQACIPCIDFVVGPLLLLAAYRYNL